MNRGLGTRMRRLERNAPDPVQAALDALSEEDLHVAQAAVRTLMTLGLGRPVSSIRAAAYRATPVPQAPAVP